MTEQAWERLVQRAVACKATVLRTNPADGPVCYLCSWEDGRVFHTFSGLAQLSIHLEGIEQRNAEREEFIRSSKRMTPEELRIQSLQGQVSGLSTTIFAHTKQLTGERPIGRITLVMAQAEGRNHLQDLEAKRATAIRDRLRIADELALLGKKPPRYAEYLAAAKALDTGGTADGH